MKFRCFIFDLDGTLVDSLDDLTNAVNHMRSKYALAAIPRSVVQGTIGNGRRDAIEKSFKLDDIVLSEDDLQKAMKLYNDYYAEHQTDETVTYPGVLETLSKLRERGCFCAVATNKRSVEACNILQQLGIMQYINCVIGDGENIPLKPAAEPLIEAARRLNVPLNECVMVGDNYTDLGAARAANISSIFCTYGLGSKKNETAFAEISSITELENFAI